jgi:hypothetical protein
VVALVCRDADGQLGEQLLYLPDLDGLSLQEPGSRWRFVAREFQLAAEAMRIRLAGRHDPMLAVSSSETGCRNRSARWMRRCCPAHRCGLLGDDLGAGKTLITGLYTKELMARGDVTRLLIVAPGGLVEQCQDELALHDLAGVGSLNVGQEFRRQAKRGDMTISRLSQHDQKFLPIASIYRLKILARVKSAAAQ